MANPLGSLPSLKSLNTKKRTAAPKVRRPPIRTNLPTNLKHGRRRVVGPGTPPPGFVSATTSGSEWIMYWALWKVLHEDGDPRRPPFHGGLHFDYQVPLGGGRHNPGGTVVDFVVKLPRRDIGLYLQTDRYHLTAGARQTAFDQQKLLQAARYMKVVPVFESDIIADPTGEQACRTMVGALGGRAQINPKTAGTYRPTRMGRLYGSQR